ncbi:MAG: thiamine-phosphate kinase [Planctomycetota bacterium]
MERQAFKRSDACRKAFFPIQRYLFCLVFVEQSFLAYLRGRCRSLPPVDIGIGDDAAIVVPDKHDAGKGLVLCTDQIVDGVDFESQSASLADVGYKAVAINLSDIAAMGAEPQSILVTLTLPQTNATEIAGEVYEGILEICKQHQVAIAGGDITTYDGPLAISVTAQGWTAEPWLRSTAKEGDAVFVSGELGGSLLGRHLRPQPRLDLARFLRSIVTVTSAIDVSDGFSLDLDRLCASSRVGVELDLERLPISTDAIRMSEKTGRSPREHAWSDGEDFELLFTVPSEQAGTLVHGDLPVPVHLVGEIVGRTGLWSRADGKLTRVFPQGYIHEQTNVCSD